MCVFHAMFKHSFSKILMKTSNTHLIPCIIQSTWHITLIINWFYGRNITDMVWHDFINTLRCYAYGITIGKRLSQNGVFTDKRTSDFVRRKRLLFKATYMHKSFRNIVLFSLLPWEIVRNEETIPHDTIPFQSIV